jgi:CBS-domain-containing membrane protein
MSNSLVLNAASAADLMTAGPVSLSASSTTAEATDFLATRHFGAAVVIDQGGHAVGVVTKSDLLIHARVRSAADATPVRDVMTPAVLSVREDTPARSVVDQLLALGVHHLFVTDAAGTVVGVISPLDVLKKLA